jgi:large subunit ribosomal protein L25
MSQQTPTLNASLRTHHGSRHTRRLRAAGKLPAVIYGHGEAPLSISLDEKETLRHLHQGIHVFTVRTEHGEETCLVKDLQFGYLGDNVIHIDMARVNLDEEVEVRVHLEFRGTPAAAAKAGVVLTHGLNEIEVACKVRDIPDAIVIDLGSMGEAGLHAREIPLPAGARLLTDPEAVIAHLEFVAEAVAGEAAAPQSAASPEVVTARKDKEGGAAG